MLKRYIRILKYGISLDRAYLLIRVIALIITFIASSISLLLPKYLLNAIAAKKLMQILVLLLATLCSGLINALSEKITSPILATRREKMNAKILDDFLKKSIDLELSYFDRPNAYDKYTLAFDQCCTVVQNSFDILFSFVAAILQVAVTLYILSWLSPLLLILFIIVCIVQSRLNNMARRDSYQFQKKMTRHNRKLNYLYRLFYIPEFMRDIRVNNLQSFIFVKKDTATQDVLADTYMSNKKISTKSFLITLFSLAESFVLMLFFSLQVINGVIWYDDFVVSLNAYNQLKNAVSQILSCLVEQASNDLYAKDYLAFMDDTSGVVHGGKKILSDVSSIEFKNVSFQYPTANTQTLENISFSVHKGERIAVIGDNGAGKTTIIKLLLRLYEPSSGEILINGVNILEYDIDTLRRVISVLFQDYSLYAFSVRENLALGADASDEDIYQALEQVNLKDKIAGLPHGLDTPITNQFYEGGIEFSGGEKQRLALARIYLKSDQMFILDEPTSNLDPFIENAFYQRLLSNTTNTMIIISHTITFASSMDKVICIRDGKIAEMGTPEELLQQPKSIYKQMYDLSTAQYL